MILHHQTLRNELEIKLTDQIDELTTQINDLKVLMVTSQKDMLIKLFAIIFGTVGMAVTILKLF